MHVIAYDPYVSELTISGRCGAGESGRAVGPFGLRLGARAAQRGELITHSPLTRSPK